MSWNNIVTAVAAFIISLVATGLMRRFALRRNLLDVPNLRSSHTSPTPRGGGVAIVLAFFAALVVLAFLGEIDARAFLALSAGGGVTALVGFLDDRWSLPAGVRFAVHVAAALCVLVSIGGVPESALLNWGLHGIWIGGVIAAVTLIWATNLFNFMDGIDGIAGTEAVFIAGAGAWINWHHGGSGGLTAAMLCLGAASLGFLCWNWPPARIFMGDVGSGFLGFSIAVLGLTASQRSAIPVEVWSILGGVFLIDSTVTLVRRMLRGDKWFEAHRLHAYQHLARRWKSHLLVTTLVIVVDVVWLVPWAMFAAEFPARAPLFLIAALLPVAGLVLFCRAGSKET
jgi:Fuc2NAc and GlcNAc transferase